jgi:hypothetical protein
MNLHFCDLCNESIPQADLDEGRAVRRNDRLICRACEAAMSAPSPAVDAPLGSTTQRIAPPSARAAPGSPAVVAVGLAFSAVALVLAAGSAAFLLSQLERRSRELERRITALQQSVPEPTRRIEAALTEERLQREEGLAAASAEARGLAARLEELERAGRHREELERRAEALGERLGALDELERRSDQQGRALEDLSSSMTRLEAALAASTAEPEKPQRAAVAAGEPAAPQAAPKANPPWQKSVADLTSPNSGTRWQAVQALGDTADPAVAVHLLRMLEDEDIFVRMAATRVLGDLGAVEAIPALIEALEDEEASVREAALVSLRALSRQNIPFDPLARDGDRSKRVKAWRDWWEQAGKELLAGAESKAKG